MRITQIKKPKTDTAYIVGTGPSMRCFPLKFLEGKFIVGLNQAWRYISPTLSVTVHPELVGEYVEPRPPVVPTKWVVKKKPPMEHLELDDPKYYVFGTSYDIATIRTQPADTLYLGEGVQTTAMDLAARLGVKYIVLVGCDAAVLGGDYHGHDQHVRWLGLKPDDQYRLYRERTAEVRAVLRGMGVHVVSMSPFIGADAAQEDYARLCKELNLDKLPSPKDTSTYTRSMPRTNNDRK
jgi:hypothetical protein